jgi:hypothetical protein
LILIEASPLSIPQWYAGSGKDRLPMKEETFYVDADVKLSLSSLRAEAISPLEHTKRSLRAATVPRALECVRLISLKPPSIRVGLLPPNT